MNKFHVFLICTPEMGNLIPLVQFARLLTTRDPRFSATVLIITVEERHIVKSYVKSQATSAVDDDRITFVYLPTVDPPSPDQYTGTLGYLSLFIEKHKPHVRNVILDLMEAGYSDSMSDSVRVAGLFVDMFCTSMIEVARQLGVPCYLYFASPASFLGFMLNYPALEAQLATEFVDSGTELFVPRDSSTEFTIPSFANPLPHFVLPSSVLRRGQGQDGYLWYLRHARKYKEVNGIIVNTFQELEPFAIRSISGSGTPPVFPIGPVLDLVGPVQWYPDRTHQEYIMKWLDDQPPSSVVFLCFGSMGSLGGPQVKEIAIGLERTRFRFLWSIRKPSTGKVDLPDEYANIEEVLPDGFLDRTVGIGLVCGWVPQVTILAHQAIGGFVSHCGWNSVLESLWYGVPIATWPLYAEQQMNAFELVKELGLAVEVRLDSRKEFTNLVSGNELGRALKRLMDGGDEARRKVKEMKEKARMSVMENGSSYNSLGSLIQELVDLLVIELFK
ncbi:UDP-glycosyltransferase 43-like [Pistacia vera]|uniref:UDP-glycosyltransferase 43-like n=1 Tax=Pistacia vera TaxID=55513 RepID=UPI0012631C67|nr:UDP-glycosyltransferase 43-like [Pistacia vera]